MANPSHPSSPAAGRARARDLGIAIGRLAPGPANAITDVPGVRVGHTTLIRGDGPLVVGRGPVRTGVTVIVPCDNVKSNHLFAGHHVLNGCGEMTGLAWIAESGFLSSPIALTNTCSVGTVHEALIAYDASWGLPVVAETWDGWLSDIQGLHVRREHVGEALGGAAGGAVAEGCVGGGTGMICHGFKGGIGTASRVLAAAAGGWSTGVLVQANYGQRRNLRVNGVPVGARITTDEVPDPYNPPAAVPAGAGSIIVIVATDAPLVSTQCRRLAQRATIGVGRVGGLGEDPSGDIFLAFSTANQGLAQPRGQRAPFTVQMLPNEALTPLFEAVADATEEAILNALCAATTMTGVDGRTVHALPLDRVRQLLTQPEQGG